MSETRTHAEELAEEFGAEVDAVKAFASYHGGYDFTEEQFNEAYLGEAYDDSDTALKKWFFEEWLEEVSSDALVEFLNLAQELAIQVNYHDVDVIAVKQDFTNENGYIFRTDY